MLMLSQAFTKSKMAKGFQIHAMPCVATLTMRTELKLKWEISHKIAHIRNSPSWSRHIACYLNPNTLTLYTSAHLKMGGKVSDIWNFDALNSAAWVACIYTYMWWWLEYRICSILPGCLSLHTWTLVYSTTNEIVSSEGICGFLTFRF